MTRIKPWRNIGMEMQLASKDGKKLTVKLFNDPQTGKQKDCVQFVQDDWCVVLALTDDERVLVVSQFKPGRDSMDRGLPFIPLEFGYTAEETVMCELRKVTGYQIENENIVPLGIGYMSPDNSSARFHCFLAVNCQKVGPGRLDQDENVETCLVPLQEWISEVTGGIISEPSAVMATFRALPFLDLHIVPIPE